MNEATIKEFEKLSAYWNKALAFEGRALADGYVEDDWRRICPSSKLIEAIKRLKGSDKVLDYGAGSGWASIAAVKCGANNILAVDTAENSVKMVGYYAKAFGVDKEITPQLIDSEWLIKEDDESYDGIICSNVLDVIPLEMMEESLANLARILKKGSLMVVGLNFFLNEEDALKQGFEVKGKGVYVANVLRLLLIDDSSWREIFQKYFEIESLEHFAWEGEKEETRRLFVLKKK